MQALQDADNGGAPGSLSEPPEGILEGTDQLRLYVRGELRARAYSAANDTMNGTYRLGRQSYQLEWRRWRIGRLVWSRTSALLLLQGATIHSRLYPFLLLSGRVLHPFSPLPGLEQIVLAELYSPPRELSYPQLFQMLLPEAGSLT